MLHGAKFNPLTSRVKPWVVQSFLSFDCMDRSLKCIFNWKVVEQYFTLKLFVFHFTQFVILENLSTLDLALKV